MLRKINSVCICGAGTMGRGIAEVFASGGFSTILYDVNEEILLTAGNKISDNLRKLVSKNKISEEEKANIYKYLRFTTQIKDCKSDLIIEAIIEDLPAKVSLFNDLKKINPGALFASNTSSLSIAAIAGEAQLEKSFIGLHFFNPAPLMKLVEIISTLHTSDELIDAARELITRLGKTGVVCKDAPGFIVNRVARPFYIESLRIAEEGPLTVDTIDNLLESRGFKMGPFKLMDLIGNDINYAVSNSLYNQLNKPGRLKPSPLQEEKVSSGHLGKKTGRGFYTY
ncbi:MAG TPA: 3-hydroxyacyl-CoA dehydrogenase NAD-binding domain-containing protein [Chitinophagaceae bacterium]|nr:3-hydroxyacyl-CoA dehydrogenase NAD-binding domain-containing protein [Chitinophagaceae bacterium]